MASLHERGLGRVGRGQHESAPGALCADRHRQRAPHGAQLSAERELAREFETAQRVSRKLAGRGEYAERDRQIEAAGFLRQIRGREVDRDVARGKLEVRVLQRRAHAIARFLHFGFRQADDGEARKTIGEMHFHRDRRRVHAREGPAVEDCKRHVRRTRVGITGSNGAARSPADVRLD